MGTYDDKEKKKIAMLAKKETLKSYNELQTYIFIPTITNATISDYVEETGFKRKNLLYQIREAFKNKTNGYEFWYTWHSSCLNTLSLINLFLVQLFNEKNWKLDYSFKAKIFKESLENRKPGIVSLIEFDVDFLLVEEENIETGTFYTNRTFRIFVCDRILKQFESKSLSDLEEIFSAALQASQDKLLNIKRPKNDKFVHFSHRSNVISLSHTSIQPSEPHGHPTVEQGVTVVNNYYQPGVVVAGNAQVREGAFNVGVIAGNINEIQDGAIISSSKISAPRNNSMLKEP